MTIKNSSTKKVRRAKKLAKRNMTEHVVTDEGFIKLTALCRQLYSKVGDDDAEATGDLLKEIESSIDGKINIHAKRANQFLIDIMLIADFRAASSKTTDLAVIKLLTTYIYQGGYNLKIDDYKLITDLDLPLLDKQLRDCYECSVNDSKLLAASNSDTFSEVLKAIKINYFNHGNPVIKSVRPQLELIFESTHALQSTLTCQAKQGIIHAYESALHQILMAITVSAPLVTLPEDDIVEMFIGTESYTSKQ